MYIPTKPNVHTYKTKCTFFSQIQRYKESPISGAFALLFELIQHHIGISGRFVECDLLSL